MSTAMGDSAMRGSASADPRSGDGASGAGATSTRPPSRAGPPIKPANSLMRSASRPVAHRSHSGSRCRQPTSPVPASASATPGRPQPHEAALIDRTRCLLYRRPRS
ncbi:MAG TPA: hypothetical protein VNV62_07840 [Trebonia sp.]|nr:hypothetical protein [Trebonia sp.]